MKIGDLVKIRYSRGQGMGVIVSEPRLRQPAAMVPPGRTNKKVCEVLFAASEQVATRGCADLEVISDDS